MTAPIDYTIRRKLLTMQPGQFWTIGTLTVQVFINADTMRWVIQSAGVVQRFRYPRHQGRRLAARIEVTAYILGHYRDGFARREWWIDKLADEEKAS